MGERDRSSEIQRQIERRKKEERGERLSEIQGERETGAQRCKDREADEEKERGGRERKQAQDAHCTDRFHMVTI